MTTMNSSHAVCKNCSSGAAITEYAVVLALVLIIAFMTFGRNGNMETAIVSLFSSIANVF